ncbi:MAG: hypothetical protein U5K56_18005 [Halioglobus sp.]|nr:hypothetical protein [Halioglobus sp.]
MYWHGSISRQAAGTRRAGSRHGHRSAAVPRTPPGYPTLAALALSEGDQEGARELYLKHCENDGAHLLALLQTARLEGERGDASMGRIYLQRAVRSAPRSAGAAPAAGLLLPALRPVEGAPALLEPLSPLQRGSPRIQAVEAGGETAVERTNGPPMPTPAALPHTHPGSEKYLPATGAGRAGNRAGKRRSSRTCAASLRQTRTTPARCSALLVLAEAAGDAQTINRYLDDLDRQGPGSRLALHPAVGAPPPPRAGAKTDKALRPGRARLSRAHPAGATLLELVALQQRTGQPDRARETLADWIARHPEDIDVRLTLGRRYRRRGMTRGANGSTGPFW